MLAPRTADERVVAERRPPDRRCVQVHGCRRLPSATPGAGRRPAEHSTLTRTRQKVGAAGGCADAGRRLILVSVDDHVVEPPDLFDGRLPAAAAEPRPASSPADDGSDVWMFEGSAHPQRRAQRRGRPAAGGVRHRPPGFDRDAPRLLRHPRAHRRHERQRRARLAQLPVDRRLRRPAVLDRADKDVALELVQAYNDWHIDEWCGTYPGRIIPLAIPPVWDPELMADEVRRMAAKGCHAVTFSENPEKLGLPELPHRPLGPVLGGAATTPARSCACTSARRRRWPSPRPTRRST